MIQTFYGLQWHLQLLDTKITSLKRETNYTICTKKLLIQRFQESNDCMCHVEIIILEGNILKSLFSIALIGTVPTIHITHALRKYLKYWRHLHSEVWTRPTYFQGPRLCWPNRYSRAQVCHHFRCCLHFHPSSGASSTISIIFMLPPPHPSSYCV